LAETVRLTATTLPLVCFLADASGVGAGATAGDESQALQAPQAGSAPQPGSQPALQSGSQQLVQLLWQRFFFAWWIAFSRSRIR
jgi:hypothetical protein